MFRSSRDIIHREAPKAVDKSEPIKYRCDFCSDEYLSESEVEFHRKTTHDAEMNDLVQDLKRIVCRMCFRELPSWDSLIKHTKSIHLLSSEDAVRVERDIYVCDNCDQIFFNKLLLAAHVTRNHIMRDRRLKYIECPKCNKIVQVNYLWSHFQSHEIQRSLCCPICLRKCKDKDDMRDHASSHPYCYRCEMCFYETNKRLYFQQHIKKHAKCLKSKVHIKESLLKECFVPKNSLASCNKVNELRCTISQGITLPGIMCICVFCREICTDQSKRKHLLEHLLNYDHMPKKKGYKCVCGEEFTNNVLLKHHILMLKEGHWAIGEMKKLSEIKKEAEDDIGSPSTSEANVWLKSECVDVKSEVLDMKSEVLDIKSEFLDVEIDILDMKNDVESD